MGPMVRFLLWPKKCDDYFMIRELEVLEERNTCWLLLFTINMNVMNGETVETAGLPSNSFTIGGI